MEKTLLEPWIKLKNKLDQKDCEMIRALQTQCCSHDQIALKLELDYKLADALNSADASPLQNINEFMCFEGERLIGYIGICSFGSSQTPFEVTGMVHPEYRRLGVFSKLHELVIAECKRRNAAGVLVLCDKKAAAGQEFIKKIGASYEHSEFEMYLRSDAEISADSLQGIAFQKATNADARELARQNAIYFGNHEKQDNEGTPFEPTLLPEEEEKHGVTIYFAEKGEQIVGKAHLQQTNGLGGIYGLGVLPENRGKGLGRAILLKSIEKLRETGANEIMLQVATENAAALNLYKSCGFEQTSAMDYFKLK